MFCSEGQSAIYYSKCLSSVNPLDNEGSRSIAAVIHFSLCTVQRGKHPPEITEMPRQASPEIMAKQHLHPRSVFNVLQQCHWGEMLTLCPGSVPIYRQGCLRSVL